MQIYTDTNDYLVKITVKEFISPEIEFSRSRSFAQWLYGTPPTCKEK